MPTIADLDIELWGIELTSQGRFSVLRIYIHKEGGVNVDHCATVSREIGDLLDVEEVFNDRFTLEVSSPGMDCILFKPEHYAINVGQQVDVRLNVPLDGSKRVVGLLAGLEDDEVIVQQGDEEYVLPLENIYRARVVPTFEDNAKS